MEGASWSGALAPLLLVMAPIACRPSASTSPDAALSSPSPTSETATAPSPVRRSWYAPYGPETGSFVGNPEEDFVGAFRDVDGAKTTLFAVDGADQHIVWTKDVPGLDADHELRIAVVAGRIGWTRQDDQIRVLDAATGAEQRTIDVRGQRAVDRLCSRGIDRPMVMAPLVASHYDALVNLETGEQPNNSGMYPRPACSRGPRFQALPGYVAKLVPADLEPAKEPMYGYEPGRLVARPRKGRPDPVLVGLKPSGQPLWRLRLGESEPAPLELLDVRARGDELVVLASRSANDGLLLAVDAQLGAVRWTAPIECGARSVEVSLTRIYVVDGANRLVVLDRPGKVLATFGERAPGSCTSGR